MSDDEFGFDDDDAWWKAAEKAQDEFGFDDDDWEAAEIAAVAVTATAATKKRKWNDHEDKVDRSPFFSGPSRTKRVCALSSATGHVIPKDPHWLPGKVREGSATC